MGENVRTITMSVQGGFINDLALEKCYLDHDICYAVDLLMSCLKTDQLSEGDRLMLALRVLNGEVEIHGTYPGDDYGPVELEVKNPKYDLRAMLTGMKETISSQKKEIEQLNKKLACCGEQLDEAGMRKANRAWRDEWCEEGKIFSGISDSVLSSAPTGLVGEFLERMHRSDSDEDYGWLEPSGVFHPVEWGQHEEWACEQVKLKDWFEEWTLHGGGGLHSFGDFLVYRRGWVLLHNPAQGLARPTFSDTKPLTKAQKEFLFDYYTERERPDLARTYWED